MPASSTQPLQENPVGGLDRLLVRICIAMMQLERIGVVHNDIKPDNMSMDDDGHIMLVDFGMATATGSVLRPQRGAILYLAPEALTDQTAKGQCSSAAQDWWAVGNVLYSCAVGVLPGAHPFLPGQQGALRLAKARSLAAAVACMSAAIDSAGGVVQWPPGCTIHRAWRQLVQGLLTTDPAARWGLCEVLCSEAFNEAAAHDLIADPRSSRVAADVGALLVSRRSCTANKCSTYMHAICVYIGVFVPCLHGEDACCAVSHVASHTSAAAASMHTVQYSK